MPSTQTEGTAMIASQPHEIVYSVATAGVAARCVHVVADLGVADAIGDEAVSVSELARGCGADADALDRVLRLLVAHGLFEHRGDAYAHTAASQLLRSDHPMSMRAFASMFGLPAVWGSLTALQHSVRTGAPAVQTIEPAGFWAYPQARPDEAAIFGQAMTAKAAADIAGVVGGYDFGRFATIADIGGGRGHLLRAVLDAVPSAEGILFDLPEVIDSLQIDDTRLTTHAGDFFADGLPAADAYVLMEVIHDWADDECVAILRAIADAAPAGATVLVVESVIDEAESDARAQTLDIVMLTVTGGRERTAGQLAVLFERAGLRTGAVIATEGAMRIAEASA